MVRLVDLEFSETLELDNPVSGGFGLYRYVDLETHTDIDFEIDIELDFDLELAEGVNIYAESWVELTEITGTIETDLAVPQECLDNPYNPCYITLTNSAGIPIEGIGTLSSAIG